MSLGQTNSYMNGGSDPDLEGSHAGGEGRVTGLGEHRWDPSREMIIGS